MTDTLTTPTPTVTDPADPVRVVVLVASVRTGRLGDGIGAWAADRVRARTGLAVDLIDLADVGLPPNRDLGTGGTTTAIAARLDAADAFMVVTPEYNHSIPAALKAAIDWHHTEWEFKAAAVLSYGAVGGIVAAEHLRTVFAELRTVTTRRFVGVPAPWNLGDDDGWTPGDDVVDAVDLMLTELEWWATTLRTARRERPFDG